MKRTLLILVAALSACVPSVYDQPYPVEAVVLPRDDAAHPAPIEWWYYTGHLSDAQGQEFGFELTFFKAYTPPQIKLFSLLPANALVEKGHVGHFAITDKARGSFHSAEIADFWGYEASTSAEALDVRLANWRAVRAEDGVSHQISASGAGYELDLVLTAQKPAALHGNPPGIQSMGPGGVSYYLSYTRMSAEGVLKRNCTLVGCEQLQVSGQAWHDHQWGDFDLSSYAGWDWFSLQLADNSELMLYLIRQPSGVYSAQAGSFIDSEGQTFELSAADFLLTETGETWTSPETGAIYPMSWRIEVPNRGIDVSVKPVMLEQEMNTRATTGIVYWEGAVEVSGSHGGVGYVELTNYDRYPYGQTDDTTPLYPLGGPFGSGNN